MDYKFVPNLTFGIKVLREITNEFKVFVDGHLMLDIPAEVDVDAYFTPFIDAGLNLLTMHWSSFKSYEQCCAFLALKHSKNIKVGIAVTVEDDLTDLLPLLPQIDTILVMSIKPGFGGQKFQPSALKLIADFRAIIDKTGVDTIIEVDGGIKPHTAKECIDAGVDALVAGSFIFGNEDIAGAIKELQYER